MKINSYLIFLIFLSTIFINPWGISPYALGKYSFLLISLGVSLIFGGFSLLSEKKISIKFNKSLSIYAMLIFFSYLFSILISSSPNLGIWGIYDSFHGLYTLIILILFGLIISNTLSKEKSLKLVISFVVAIGIISSIYAIFQKIGFDPIPHGNDEKFVGRVYGFFGHPNFLGQFLLFPIWFNFFLIKKPYLKKENLFCVFSFLIMLTALFLTANRASILALSTSVFLLFVYKKTEKLSLKILSLLITILVIIISIYLFSPYIRSLSSRLILWQGSFKLILEHPFLGNGINTFYQKFQQILDPQIYNFEPLYSTPTHIHNFLLKTIYERGLFGLVTELFLIFSLLKIYLTQKIKNYSKPAFFALISFFISLQFGFSTPELNLLVIFALFLIFPAKNKLIINNSYLSKIGAILIILIGIHPLLYGIKSIKADVLIKKNISYFLQGAPITEIENNFLEIINLNPHFTYISETALTFLRESQSSKTLFLEKMALIGGKDYKYYHQLALINWQAQKNEEAEINFKKSLALAPANISIYSDYAEFLIKNNKKKEAISVLEKLSSLHTNIADRSNRIFIKTNPFFVELMKQLEFLKTQ